MEKYTLISISQSFYPDKEFLYTVGLFCKLY